MNRRQLVVRNLRYHLRGNLAVLLGAAVGAAVLGGALLVGDSLRGSLRQRAERQLGNVDNVLVGSRFLRDDLPSELPGSVRGALLLQGTVRAGEQRLGKVSVWGVNQNFGIDQPVFATAEPVVVLAANVAKALQVKVGDAIFVGVQKSAAMPRSSFLSARGISDTTRTFKLTVSAILPESDPANALSLSISPSLPLNIFVPIARLQQEIDQPGKINALLGSGQSAQSLQTELRAKMNLEDWGLKLRIPENRKSYVSVESKRLILDPAIVDAVEKTAHEMDLRSAPTLSYLAKSIDYKKQGLPYSVIAALDPKLGPPLGPFLPEGISELQPGDIVLADWKKSPLKIDPADQDPHVTVRYFLPEIESHIEERSHVFRYRGKIPLADVAADPNLTPPFPGITDKNSIADWDPPPQLGIDTKRIKEIDPSAEEYWDKYRTTPKAYIRLDDGQALWGTRFGNTTSIRIAPKDGAHLEKTRSEFAERLLKNLDPASVGLIVQPIRERMLAAGEGSQDFGMLFLMFSFFLIFAALMLVGLLFRLNIDRRAGEIGLLRSSGFSLRTVRWLLLIEGLTLATIGSLIGLAGAILYADLMIRLLVDLWPTPGVETYLSLHVTWLSLAIGFGAAVLMSGAAIYWALRSLNQVAPATLLKGDTTPALDPKGRKRRSSWTKPIAFTAFVCALTLGAFGPFMPPGEPQAGTFFGSGSMLLIGCLTLLWGWLKRTRRSLLNGHGVVALARLGSRNAERNPTRSILTASLLAFAAFLLVAVESFRREPERDFLDQTGGSGGFALLGETATPIDFDLNDNEGREQLEIGLERYYQGLNLSADVRTERVKDDMAKLKDTNILRFRVHNGDDASCLNLYQATRPRLMGVPQSIIERGGFSFADTIAHRDNPWLQLVMPADPGQGIPCIVENNTAMWMLKKGLGDTFEVPDEDGHPIKLKIVALLQDSVFQSEVLIPDAAFTHYFPHTEGFSFFLIETPPQQETEVARILSNGLESYGFDVTPTKDRVAAFLAVENTYLTTFQLLGGFGLLLGVLGLSVVLLRSVWERRAEMALLRALGYRKRSLNAVVLAENGLLLLLGLGAGVFAALAAVAPHLATGGHISWLRLGFMLGSIVVVGLGVAFAAIVSTLRAPLIPALREEG